MPTKLGAFAAQLKTELEKDGFKVRDQDLRWWQKSAEALMLLSLQGLLTGTEIALIKQRLAALVLAKVSESEN